MSSWPTNDTLPTGYIPASGSGQHDTSSSYIPGPLPTAGLLPQVDLHQSIYEPISRSSYILEPENALQIRYAPCCTADDPTTTPARTTPTLPGNEGREEHPQLHNSSLYQHSVPLTLHDQTVPLLTRGKTTQQHYGRVSRQTSSRRPRHETSIPPFSLIPHMHTCDAELQLVVTLREERKLSWRKVSELVSEYMEAERSDACLQMRWARKRMEVLEEWKPLDVIALQRAYAFCGGKDWERIAQKVCGIYRQS